MPSGRRDGSAMMGAEGVERPHGTAPIRSVQRSGEGVGDEGIGASSAAGRLQRGEP